MTQELKEKIEQLDAIISCKIMDNEQGNIDEIHIIATKERKPKRIVRDIETIVLVNFDQEISHKKISIARINQKQLTQESDRIIIVSIYQEHNNSDCYLKLKINDELVEKRVKGSPEEPVTSVVVRGMIEIIENHTNFPGKIRVENIFKTGLNEEILIAQLILHDKDFRSRQRLLGAAYIEHNILLAVGKACLKALNRRVFN